MIQNLIQHSKKIIQFGRPLRLPRPAAIFFLYHTIEDQPSPWTQGHRYITSFDNFKRQIEYIKKRFKIEPSSELVKKIRLGILKENTAAIHFDDGFRSYTDLALPYLKSQNIPSAVFLVDSLLDGEIPIRNKMAYCLNTGRRQGLLRMANLDPATNDAAFLSQIKNSLTPEIEDSVGALYRSALPPGPGPFLTREEVRAICQDPLVEIGSHTLNHKILAKLSEEKQREEVLEGHRKIESFIGRETSLFAYPFGAKIHFDDATRSIVRENERLVAFSTYGGINYDFDATDIKRITLAQHRPYEIKLAVLENRESGA